MRVIVGEVGCECNIVFGYDVESREKMSIRWAALGKITGGK